MERSWVKRSLDFKQDGCLRCDGLAGDRMGEEADAGGQVGQIQAMAV